MKIFWGGVYLGKLRKQTKNENYGEQKANKNMKVFLGRGIWVILGNQRN